LIFSSACHGGDRKNQPNKGRQRGTIQNQKASSVVNEHGEAYKGNYTRFRARGSSETQKMGERRRGGVRGKSCQRLMDSKTRKV